MALPVADRMIWGRSSLNPLLIVATVCCSALRWRASAIFNTGRPGRGADTASRRQIQRLLFELGLLLTVTWIVDLIIKVFIKK